MTHNAHKLKLVSTFALSTFACAGVPAIGLATLTMSSGQAIAQNTSSDDASTKQIKRSVLVSLSKPISLDVEDQPLEDIFNFIAEVTGVELEPIYLNENFASNGMDPETLITMKASNTPALIVLERVLLRAQRAESIGEEYTWQFTDYGSIEFGPKTELNRNQQVELYDIADLLFVVQDFDNAPEFDLQSAVSQAGGGGGGGGSGSPFSSGGGNVTSTTSAENAQALTDLIQSTIEPDQWAALGGDGASMTFYNNSFIITAPDYIHRQIAGYSFWPSKLQQVRKVNGKQQTIIKPAPKKRKP
ncbi:MAG: hypothetical protein P1U42_03445 [Phycisphaerales bacterium]|nr:hypothetical protein [Phycisphaerales bacterium]